MEEHTPEESQERQATDPNSEPWNIQEDVPYNPDTVATMSPEDIDAIENRVHEMKEAGSEPAEIQAYINDTLLIKYDDDGNKISGFMDPTQIDGEGNAIVRVQGKDGQAVVRGMVVGEHDFGTHVTRMRPVEIAPAVTDAAEQGGAALARNEEAEQAAVLEDARDDVEEIFEASQDVTPATDEQVATASNEEAQRMRAEQDAEKQRAIEEALAEEKRTLAEYETVLSTRVGQLGKLCETEQIAAGRQMLHEAHSRLAPMVALLSRDRQIPSRGQIAEMMLGLESVQRFLDREAANIAGDSNDLASNRGEIAQADSGAKKKLVSEGNFAHAHRLANGAGEVINTLDSNLKNQQAGNTAISQTIDGLHRLLGQEMAVAHHNQGVEAYASQIRQALTAIETNITARGGWIRGLDEIRAGINQFVHKLETE